MQIEGDAAPALYERRWLDLPAGRYVVQVVVVRATGEAKGASTQFTALDPRAEGPPEP